MGATNQGSTAAALLAYVLAQQGRHEEAIRYADLATAWAAPDDTASQLPQLAARAHVLAARGDLERAEATAREAVRLSERSDDICQRGDALVQLAAVLGGTSRASDAATVLQHAMARHERKGNLSSPPIGPKRPWRTSAARQALGRVAVVESFTISTGSEAVSLADSRTYPPRRHARSPREASARSAPVRTTARRPRREPPRLW